MTPAALRAANTILREQCHARTKPSTKVLPAGWLEQKERKRGAQDLRGGCAKSRCAAHTLTSRRLLAAGTEGARRPVHPRFPPR